jgi:hypothetical protein
VAGKKAQKLVVLRFANVGVFHQCNPSVQQSPMGATALQPNGISVTALTITIRIKHRIFCGETSDATQ